MQRDTLARGSMVQVTQACGRVRELGLVQLRDSEIEVSDDCTCGTLDPDKHSAECLIFWKPIEPSCRQAILADI